MGDENGAAGGGQQDTGGGGELAAAATLTAEEGAVIVERSRSCLRVSELGTESGWAFVFLLGCVGHSWYTCRGRDSCIDFMALTGRAGRTGRQGK